MRLFKKDAFRYEEVYVHPRLFLKGETKTLNNPLLHYSYKNISHYMQKLDNQTTLEAKKWIATNRHMSFFHALWRAVDRCFYRRLLKKKGYRDGIYGYAVAFFSGAYQLISYFKYWEMKRYASTKD